MPVWMVPVWMVLDSMVLVMLDFLPDELVWCSAATSRRASRSAPGADPGAYWQPQPLVDPGSVPRPVPQQVGLLLGSQQ